LLQPIYYHRGIYNGLNSTLDNLQYARRISRNFIYNIILYATPFDVCISIYILHVYIYII